MRLNKGLSLLFLVILACVIIMQACIFVPIQPAITYTKNDKDLYSVAIHSVFGVTSSGSDEIIVLEQDQYGRKLFFANLGAPSVGGISGIFILQKTDDNYAYYYEDVNYIIKKGCIGQLTKEKVFDFFPEEDTESLKQYNDWGKEQTGKDLFRVPITGDKYYLYNKVLNDTVEPIKESLSFFNERWGYTPLCEDSYGTTIWLMFGDKEGEPQGDRYNHYYATLLNSEGKLKGDNAILEINNIWDYRDQMISFKVANHWNEAQ